MSGIKNSFVLDKTNIRANAEAQFGAGADLLNISPDKLVFNYDVNLVKKVPVILNSNIKFASGFDMENSFKMKPDSVIVIGPHSVVSNVKTIDTENLILEEVKSDISKDINLKLPTSKDLKFSVKKIHISAKVKKFTEGVLKVPVTIVNVPDGIVLNYFPKYVNVSYYTNLENFSSIKAEDFSVECDFNNVEDQRSFLIPIISKAPNGVKNLKISQQHVEFIILE